jgi:hypothetical protein
LLPPQAVSAETIVTASAKESTLFFIIFILLIYKQATLHPFHTGPDQRNQSLSTKAVSNPRQDSFFLFGAKLLISRSSSTIAKMQVESAYIDGLMPRLTSL